MADIVISQVGYRGGGPEPWPTSLYLRWVIRTAGGGGGGLSHG